MVKEPPAIAAPRDAGLGLVEVLVAMLVLTVALLALVPVQVRALSGVALAEERQQATAYADSALERVRGRAATAAGFDAVSRGRLPNTSDPDDAALTTGCPGACRFTFTSEAPRNDILVVSAPHDPALTSDLVVVGGTGFTTRLYVLPTANPTSLVTVTAVTSWTSRNGGPGVRRIAVSTQVAKP